MSSSSTPTIIDRIAGLFGRKRTKEVLPAPTDSDLAVHSDSRLLLVIDPSEFDDAALAAARSSIAHGRGTLVQLAREDCLVFADTFEVVINDRDDPHDDATAPRVLSRVEACTVIDDLMR